MRTGFRRRRTTTWAAGLVAAFDASGVQRVGTPGELASGTWLAAEAALSSVAIARLSVPAIPAHGLRSLYDVCQRCLDGQLDAFFVAFEAPYAIEGAPPWARPADSGLVWHAAVPWGWNRSGWHGSGPSSRVVESRGQLGGIEVQDGSRFLPTVQQRFEQLLHGFQRIVVE
jgi:hypothetical protein